jgi:hypothetical protein
MPASECSARSSIDGPEKIIVPNRATERAKHAIRAISKIAESASYVFSMPTESSTPPASTN